MERVTIPLASFRSTRMVTVVVAGVLAAIGVLFAIGAYAAFAAGIPFVSEGSHVAGLIAALLVLTIAGLHVWPMMAPWVGWSHAPALVIEADFLTVHHPGLGEPLVVPRQLIQVSSVDTTPASLFTLYRRFRVQRGAPHRRPRSVLFSRGIARLTAGFPSLPNVVVLFTQPVDTVRPRRSVRWGNRHFFHGGKSIRGIALAVSEPARAREELARHGPLRAISFEDLATSGVALTLR